jgi:hypothetical protein
VTTIQELIDILKSKNPIKIYTKNEKTITKFLEFNNITSNIEIIEIPAGMRYLESFIKNETYYICDDILSDIFVRKRSKKSLAKSLDLLLEIRPGDFIVHVDH